MIVGWYQRHRLLRPYRNGTKRWSLARHSARDQRLSQPSIRCRLFDPSIEAGQLGPQEAHDGRSVGNGLVNDDHRHPALVPGHGSCKGNCKHVDCIFCYCMGFFFSFYV